MITQRAAQHLLPADAIPLNTEPFTWQTPKPFTRLHKEDFLLWPGTASSVEDCLIGLGSPFLAPLSVSLLSTQHGYQTSQQGKAALGKVKASGSMHSSCPLRPLSYKKGTCWQGSTEGERKPQPTFLSLGLEESKELSNSRGVLLARACMTCLLHLCHPSSLLFLPDTGQLSPQPANLAWLHQDSTRTGLGSGHGSYLYHLLVKRM